MFEYVGEKLSVTSTNNANRLIYYSKCWRWQARVLTLLTFRSRMWRRIRSHVTLKYIFITHSPLESAERMFPLSPSVPYPPTFSTTSEMDLFNPLAFTPYPTVHSISRPSANASHRPSYLPLSLLRPYRPTSAACKRCGRIGATHWRIHKFV